MSATNPITTEPGRSSFGVRGLSWTILAVLFVAGLACVLWFAMQMQRRSADGKKAADALKWVISGLWNYNDTHGCLPPPVFVDDEGKPRASWRFVVWNYIDAASWSIPDKTRPWINHDKTEIDLRATAEVASPFSFWESSARGATRIAAITGPDSAFDEHNRCSFAQIDDDTIILIEVAHAEVRWTEPGDYTWDADQPEMAGRGSMNIGNPDGRAFHVAFQNGDIWALAADTPLAELSRFFTVQGARENDRETILGPWRR